MTLHKIRQAVGGKSIRIRVAEGADNHPSDHGQARLHVLVATAIVTNVGIGHHHELTMVGRVRKDLLVPGHTGVETELTTGFTEMSDRLSRDYGTIR
jgi:hypothetical protein